MTAAVRVALPPVADAAFRRRDPAARIVRLSGETMGTSWSAQLAAPAPDLAAALRMTLGSVIADLSHWDDASALSRFNRNSIGAWMELPERLATVLDAAVALNGTSGGAFDPAGGALADLWGFGPPGPVSHIPDGDMVAAALLRSGCDAIERFGTAARRRRDVRLDLSGIGKGHAVDALAETCRAHGCQDFLVEIGGEFVGAGIRPDGQPWWVDLEPPPGIALPPLRIAAHEVAVATSGDYRQFLYDGDRRLGHTIDPRTGRPVETGIVSASVVAGDCMTADGWATALTVMGMEAGMAVAAREALAARLVMADGREVVSPALVAMLE